MRVRRLERTDYPSCIEMLKEFSLSLAMETEPDEKDYYHARQVLLRCEKTGSSFVSENDYEITGMILSMAVPEIWFPRRHRLVEMAWWVKPEFRTSTAGGKLFAAYTRDADTKLKRGIITGYTMSKMSTSPDINYERRGFRKVEETFLKGE